MPFAVGALYIFYCASVSIEECFPPIFSVRAVMYTRRYVIGKGLKGLGCSWHICLYLSMSNRIKVCSKAGILSHLVFLCKESCSHATVHFVRRNQTKQGTGCYYKHMVLSSTPCKTLWLLTD